MGQCASAADLADSLSLLGRHPCCAEQCDLSGILASRASSLACKEFRLGRVDRLWHRAGHRRSSRATTTGERSEPLRPRDCQFVTARRAAPWSWRGGE